MTNDDFDRVKTAFRVTFDAVKECWPPEDTPKYWERVATVFCDVANQHAGDGLVWQLLLGAVNGLQSIAKERREYERSENAGDPG